NVRELANLIERLSIVCRGRIAEVSDLPPKYRPTDWNEGWVAPPFAHEIASLGTEPPADSREERDVERATSHDREEVPAAPNAVDADPAPVSESLAPEAPVTLAASDLSELPPEGIDLRAHLLTIDRRLIEQALERSNGVVAHAARLLHLRRTTLVEKLRKLGLLSGELATED